MNIAYYSHYFVPEIGAPSARVYDLSREWLESGHDVQVVTCFPNHPTGVIYPGYRSRRYDCEMLDGITVHRNWTYVTPNRGLVRKTVGHISFLASSLLFAHGHLRKPDVIIGTSPTFFAAFAAAIEARRQRRPFIMEVRDLWPAIFVELGVLRNRQLIRALENLEMWLYQAAARVVTVTEAFRTNLIERGASAEKVVTIPNGANLDFWDRRKADSGLREQLSLQGKFVVLYIGAHGISHALSRILGVAEKLRSDGAIGFVFVGEGAEKEMLMQMAAERRLTNVTFFEPVEKERVRDFYALADVCLVPLRDVPLFDTFVPSKMFEIMAMERPIVGSVHGEPAAILERSGCAEVVPPEDEAAMARAILDLRDDPQRRATMGVSGREFVIANYSRRSLAEKYLAVLREATSSGESVA